MPRTGISASAIALAAGRVHEAAGPALTRARLGLLTIDARVQGGALAAPTLGLMAARTGRRAADRARPAETRDHARQPDRAQAETAFAEGRIAQGGRIGRLVRRSGDQVTTVQGTVAAPVSTAVIPAAARAAEAGTTGMDRAGRAGARRTGRAGRTGQAGKAGVRVIGRGETAGLRGPTGRAGRTGPVRGMDRAGGAGARTTGRAGRTGPVRGMNRAGGADARTTGRAGRIGRVAMIAPEAPQTAAVASQTGGQHGTVIARPGPTALGATRGTTGPLMATPGERPAAQWTAASAQPTATGGRARGLTFRSEKQGRGSPYPNP